MRAPAPCGSLKTKTPFLLLTSHFHNVKPRPTSILRIRAQTTEEESNTQAAASISKSEELEPSTTAATPLPPTPRRRSPVGRNISDEQQEEPVERDLFIPIIVLVTIVAYGACVLMAWLEYQGF